MISAEDKDLIFLLRDEGKVRTVWWRSFLQLLVLCPPFAAEVLWETGNNDDRTGLV
jgi:hypothetical protein